VASLLAQEALAHTLAREERARGAREHRRSGAGGLSVANPPWLSWRGPAARGGCGQEAVRGVRVVVEARDVQFERLGYLGP